MGTKPKCDKCGKTAVWRMFAMTRIFTRCHEHRHLISREYRNDIFHNGKWKTIWGETNDPEEAEMTMDDVRKIGCKYNGIPFPGMPF